MKTPRLIIAAFVASLTLLASDELSALDSDEDGQEAYYQTKEGLDFELRSLSFGYIPSVHGWYSHFNVLIETDFYLNWKWIAGANFTIRGAWDTNPAFNPHLLEEFRGSIFVDRVWGGRWGHVTLRAGPFFNKYRRKLVRREDRVEEGYIFGPQLGATATFTPVRFAGITVSALAYPGIFTGSEDPCCLEDGDSRSVTRLRATAMLMIAGRIGDLDGPERDLE